MTNPEASTTPRRGRPRDTQADRAILAAFFEVVAESGYAGATMDAIAERAGVAKTTIYRRWPTKDDLLAAAHGILLREHPIPDTGTLRGDLLALVTLAGTLLTQHPMNRVAAAMIGEIAHNEPLAALFRQAVIEKRIALVAAIWDRAAARGEVPPGDWRLYAQMLMGPIIIRAVITAEPITPAFAAALVDAILRAAHYREA